MMPTHTIALEGMEFKAYHGLYKEERIIGGRYVVDVWLETDFSRAAANDELNGTIDYGAVYELVNAEMSIPSALIEHVGQRILNSIVSQYPAVIKTTVKVTKFNPPIAGDIGKVSICISN
jgi:dihydroneopterin aldolase